MMVVLCVKGIEKEVLKVICICWMILIYSTVGTERVRL